MPFLKKKDKKSGQVLRSEALKLHWDCEDPFVFVSHHSDEYPCGNAQQAPPLPQIAGRNLGRDYRKLFGFRMYNGKVVPGFPMHAHWGYETVTVAETGYIDHFDSLGNKGRYGFGDVQWLSAGSRYQHDEMYPLAFSDRDNPNDITQIMINLPLRSKNTPPELRMMWSEDIPAVSREDDRGRGYSVKVIAGRFEDASALSPNEVSWAADPDHHLSILIIRMSPGARMSIPRVSPSMNRNLYFVSGDSVRFGDVSYGQSMRFKLPGDEEVEFENGGSDGVFWLLEGEPIGERMSSFGPIILGDDREVRDALNIVREKEFEDWPWNLIDKTNPKGTERFIEYSDGRSEHPGREVYPDHESE